MSLAIKTPDWPHSLMWYTKGASEWKEALPIGNGMLAGMVFGDVGKDRIALNHERLWRGTHRSRTTEVRHQHVDEIRKLFFEGKDFEASELANEKLGGEGGVLADKGRPGRVNAYQPAGDLFIETDHQADDYCMQLDLDKALVTTAYTAGGVTYTRESFVHSSLPVMAVRLSSNGASAFTAALSVWRIDDPDCEIIESVLGDTMCMGGSFPEGINFAVHAKVVTDGQISHDPMEGAKVGVSASEVLVLLTIGVDLDDEGNADEICTQCLDDCPTNWDELLADHMEAHRGYYRRMRIELGDERPDVPTPDRLADLRDGKDDDALLALYVNLGRYLLISGSRPGGLPTNLQGKWNEELSPPWDADYHHDINLQMNYWPADVCGLGELAEPLFDHIERFVPHGREMARALYDCRGVWYPIQTDPWGRATPESRGWDVWAGAAAWLAQHMWWRWEYTRDKGFLRDHAYPFLKEVAAFYEDYLVEDPRSGKLVTVPSQSPENFVAGGTKPVSLCVAATMDLQLIHESLTNAISAAGVLGVDDELKTKWQDILDRIPPLQIGRHGQLQEWLDDCEEGEPGHRHLSHLYGLFPGDQLTLEDEPEFTQAARVSLERRLEAGGGPSGWSRAWVACCWARLREAADAYHHLKYLVSDFATGSLLDLHPPRIFQIEGNFGGTAAFCEMLMQSHNGVIRILPALPAQWAAGKVAGLHARGGFVLDIEWLGAKASVVRITSLLGEPCRIASDNLAAASGTIDGAAVELQVGEDGAADICISAGQMLELRW